MKKAGGWKFHVLRFLSCSKALNEFKMRAASHAAEDGQGPDEPGAGEARG
jgi:hypothetical protein